MAVKKGYQQSPEHVRRRIDARLATLKVKPKPVSKEWLELEYVTKGRDCVQIGAELGRDPKTIWSWLRHYGIPTRPRGASGGGAPHAFQKGENGGWTGRTHSPETRELIRQARIADGTVPYLRDGVHWLKGKRGAETPNWKGGVTAERQAFYATDEWRDAVKAVWARANGRCERCGVSYTDVKRQGGPKFHIHHIESFAVRALRAVLGNLALLCRPCHHFVHSRANTTHDCIRGDGDARS